MKEKLSSYQNIKVILINMIHVEDRGETLDILINTSNDDNPMFLFELWEILPSFNNPEEWAVFP